MKIGVLGLIHDHVWHHLHDLTAHHPDITVSVAERAEPLRERARAECGINRFYAEPADLLDRERPDAVLIYVDNHTKADLVELAAGRGLPIMLEKPLADRLVNARRIVAAVERAGVPCLLNWPTYWLPTLREALRLAAAGAVGEISRVAYRGGHGGPKEYGCSHYFYGWLYDPALNGAGAFVDYCGYGVSLAYHLLGLPESVQATAARLRKVDLPIDDNAVTVMRWPRALAIAEATWTAALPPPDGGPVITGDRGTLIVRRRGARREGVRSLTGLLELYSADDADGTLLTVPDLPPDSQNSVAVFLDHVRRQRPVEGFLGLRVGLGTQTVLEAGLQSALSGRVVTLPPDGSLAAADGVLSYPV